MKLIVGLGNPGPRYAGSRHNVGFTVVDALAAQWRADVSRYDRHFEGLIGQANVGTEVVMLLKPQTFMNLSGRSVGAVMRYYKIEPADLLVVYDDLDLPPGRVRVRASGSAGGHKGMTDVIRNLSTDAIARIRVGIGKVDRSATVDFVLSRFTPDEQAAINAAITTATQAAECWVSRGIETAMNEYNRRKDGAKSSRKPANADPAEGESS